jgi:hypothetical protein
MAGTDITKTEHNGEVTQAYQSRGRQQLRDLRERANWRASRHHSDSLARLQLRKHDSDEGSSHCA